MLNFIKKLFGNNKPAETVVETTPGVPKFNPEYVDQLEGKKPLAKLAPAKKAKAPAKPKAEKKKPASKKPAKIKAEKKSN